MNYNVDGFDFVDVGGLVIEILFYEKAHKYLRCILSVSLRLKLFDAVVSPTTLFALTRLPLSTQQIDNFGICLPAEDASKYHWLDTSR